MRLGNACREEQVPLSRDVVDDADWMDVIICRPETNSLTGPTGEDYTQLIRAYKIEFHPGQGLAHLTGEQSGPIRGSRHIYPKYFLLTNATMTKKVWPNTLGLLALIN